jgi:hypothetical protein
MAISLMAFKYLLFATKNVKVYWGRQTHREILFQYRWFTMGIYSQLIIARQRHLVKIYPWSPPPMVIANIIITNFPQHEQQKQQRASMAHENKRDNNIDGI